jgi:hypothetical protein
MSYCWSQTPLSGKTANLWAILAFTKYEIKYTPSNIVFLIFLMARYISRQVNVTFILARTAFAPQEIVKPRVAESVIPSPP